MHNYKERAQKLCRPTSVLWPHFKSSKYQHNFFLQM